MVGRYTLPDLRHSTPSRAGERQLEREAASPSPSRESTQILPAHRRHEPRAMKSPSPVPPAPTRDSASRRGRTCGRSAPARPAGSRFPRRRRSPRPVVACAARADGDRAARRRVLDARCRRGSRTPGAACRGSASRRAAPRGRSTHEAVPVRRPPPATLCDDLGRRRRARRSARASTCRSPVSSRATLSSASTIAVSRSDSDAM